MLFGNETLKRIDFCVDIWPEERHRHVEGRIGWWRSRVPLPSEKKVKLAPNDVLLNLFDQLGDELGRPELQYVLTLLLLRRRLFRIEKEENGILVVYCGKRDTVYEIPVVLPEGDGIEEVQTYLVEMLYA